MPKKLYIYDDSSFYDRWQADGRFSSDDADICTLPASSMSDVIQGLDRFLSKGMVFHRMLFQTHGDSGVIWFDNDYIEPDNWRKSFARGGYDKLFPTYARIYFDGCDVADGDKGVEFLRAAGRVFLKGMGGEVTGWTSFGLGLPGWIPFIGGHTVHPSGHIVTIRFAPGDTEGTLESFANNELVLPALGT